jgi:hypothetical protein
VFDETSYANALEIYLDRIKCDVLTLEMKDRGLAELELLGAWKGKTRKKFAIGVVSHRTLNAETPPEVANDIRKALQYIDVENLVITSDCGFGRQGANRLVAFYKSAAAAQGANIVRREHGLPETYVPCADPQLVQDVVPAAFEDVGKNGAGDSLAAARGNAKQEPVPPSLAPAFRETGRHGPSQSQRFFGISSRTTMNNCAAISAWRRRLWALVRVSFGNSCSGSVGSEAGVESLRRALKLRQPSGQIAISKLAVLFDDVAADDDGVHIGDTRVQHDGRYRIGSRPHVDVAFAQQNNIGLLAGRE